MVEYSCSSPGCCGISWLGQDLLHDSSPSFQLFTRDDLNYSKRIASSIYHRHSLSSILLLAIFRSLPCSTDMRALETKMWYEIQTWISYNIWFFQHWKLIDLCSMHLSLWIVLETKSNLNHKIFMLWIKLFSCVKELLLAFVYEGGKYSLTHRLWPE